MVSTFILDVNGNLSLIMENEKLYIVSCHQCGKSIKSKYPIRNEIVVCYHCNEAFKLDRSKAFQMLIAQKAHLDKTNL